MNSWIKHISLCLVVCMGILLVSCSQSSREREEMNGVSGDSSATSIEKVDLEGNFLSDKNIKAFEQRAIQKLEDLKDYFEILSNSKIDTSFRNQAIVMAMELFAAKENTITLSLFENRKSSVQNVESFFTSLQKGTYGMLSFEIHDISVIKNIKQLNNSEYKGAIKFRLFILTKQGNTQKLQNKINMQCEIIAKKVQKKFGKESKQVWEVFLGDIFQIP